VARFIGIEPLPLSGYLQSTEQHVIGNSMRLSAVSEIREDRTWLETLSEGDLETIARVAGSASHHLGFDWP
jgi:hypothetical protein